MKPCKSYSFAWASVQTEVFRKKHVRAAKIFEILADFSQSYPAWLLSHDPEKWVRYKAIVKFIDTLPIYDTPAKITTQVLSATAASLRDSGLFNCKFAHFSIDKHLQLDLRF